MSANDSNPPPRDSWAVDTGYGASETGSGHSTNPSLFAQSMPIKRLRPTIPRLSDSQPQPAEDAPKPKPTPAQMAAASGILAVIGVTLILIDLAARHLINGWEFAGVELLALWLWLRAIAHT